MTLHRRDVCLGLLALPALGARAQAWPTKPVTIVVPQAPGGTNDALGRILAQKLSERLGQSFLVDNRAGAGGNIGTAAAAKAPRDGHTLLLTISSTQAINPALYKSTGFDPVKDLEPVTLTSWGQLLLVTSQQSGITSAADLLSRARARPGALNYASPGNGTPHHLAMELLKAQNKLFITHIPYRGTAPAVTDLLGGQVDLMFLPIHVALQQVKAGRLHALAIDNGIALAGAGWGFGLPTGASVGMGVLGVMTLATAVLSKCSIYYAIGYSTCPVSGAANPLLAADRRKS